MNYHLSQLGHFVGVLGLACKVPAATANLIANNFDSS